MKKVIMLMMLTALTMNIYASPNQAFKVSSDTIVVRTDPITPIPDHGEPHRGLESSIFIIQDGHTLNFGTDFSGCTIYLLDENEHIEYSGVVGSDGIVAVPDYLEGLFELRLTIDNIVYAGEIQLE